MLHLNFVTAQHFGLGQNAELFHQGDVLLFLQGDHGIGGAFAVGQATAGSLSFPGFGITVAVENHTAVVVQGLLDPGGGSALKVSSALHIGNKLLQLFGNSSVQDGVGIA